MDKYFLDNENKCSCGIVHYCPADVYTGSGAIQNLSRVITDFGAEKIFLLADENTYAAAGERVEKVLSELGKDYSIYCYKKSPHPDEAATEAAFEACPDGADLIIGIGSGVINDIGKLISSRLGVRYVIVATAPSMDGYASSSSSMTVGGLKKSLPSKIPDVIIGDTDILKTAPTKMLVSGIGDMLAKYVGLSEWKIGQIITGEYYCDKVYEFMKNATESVVEAAKKYGVNSDVAVERIFAGLVAAGFAMSYANSTRPASGAEHYISHIYDMRGAAFGAYTEMHGIQAALGTLVCIELYEELTKHTPNKEKALYAVKNFSLADWQDELLGLVGVSAGGEMIELEAKENKYSKAEHAARLEVIIENWNEILEIIKGLPKLSELQDFCRQIGLPTSLADAGLDERILPKVISATRDIRDKYVLSRLIFDLGLCEIYEGK